MYKTPLKRFERKTAKKKNKLDQVFLLGVPYHLILIFLIVIPLGLILLYAMTERVNDMFLTFSLKYFIQFSKEPMFIKAMLDSIYLAVLTTVFALLIGYPTAYIIANRKPRTQAAMILVITAPMWVNMLLRTMALKQLFEMFVPNLLGGNFSIVTGMVYVFLPFMVLPIYTVLSKIDPRLYEAAHDLGANKFETFIKVTLPLSITGVLSGITMVLLPAATTLVIPKYLGGGRYLIGNLIEDRFLKNGDWGYGSAIAIILSIVIMFMVILTKKLDKNPEVDHD